MRAISPKTKAILEKDPFMRACCLCNRTDRKIDWHHNLIYAGKQSDAPESILPLCQECHSNADDSLLKEELDLYMFVYKKLDPLLYPKAGLVQRKKYLLKKYGY